MNFEDIVKETKAYNCLECAVCTGGCPIARVRSSFSPRLTVRRAVFGFQERVLNDPELWMCLTCKTCESRCPSGVDYVEFIKLARIEAFQHGARGVYSHNGVMQAIMKIMTKDVKQNRIRWVGEDLEVSDEGEFLFFVGCTPYFDVVFDDKGVNFVEAARKTVRILNRVGIAPMISNEEKCCGHDLLWTGNLDGFKKLAVYNIDLIRSSGAKKVLFACPECFYTFHEEYPRYFGDLGFEVFHISQFLAEEIDKRIKFNEMKLKVTYQDPCRLGRYMGVYEEPREIIKSIPEVELVEMESNRADSVCCGTTAWTNCFNCSKQIQTGRLSQAVSTGADLIVTGCPKCQIHFKCALNCEGTNLNIEVQDLVDLVARALGW